MLVPCCFDYYSFIIQFEIRKYNASCFAFLPQDYFHFLRFFVVPYKFLELFTTSVKALES